MLDAHDEIERGRGQLTTAGRRVLRLVDRQHSGQARCRAHQARQTRPDHGLPGSTSTAGLRERAVAGNFAWVHQRVAVYADAVWVIAPRVPARRHPRAR